MRARLTSTHFVGRLGELAELELAFRDAASGRPVVVLLGGESGVGKTRLVSEFERRVADSDGQPLVLRGEAVEQADGELPYAPLLGALRPLVRKWHPALEGLSASARSELGALLPGLDEGGPSSERDDALPQLRLFEALLELFDLASDVGPLVLILEDVHWADRSTRTFIAFLARSLREERVMLLLTYRSDELYRRHPLRPLLAELDRVERARRIEIPAFDRAELAEALSDILGEAPGEQLVDRLFARSEGNPLYTEELLAAGLDGRGAAPQTLRDAFILRIERMSEDAQRAARAIAVGRALDEPTVAQLTRIEHDALHAALREAVSEQVLVPDEEDRLCFRHALLREALYDDLLPGERSELHLALARAYEERAAGEGDPGVELTTSIATHYAAAGEQPAALRASVRAALAARSVHAFAEAADLAERALELWPRVPGAADALPLDHVELLALAARAHTVAGDRSRGEVLLRSALSELDPEKHARRYSSQLARLARIQWSLNRGQEGVETAQRALEMLPADEASSERASLLAWLARTRQLRGHFREATTKGEEALTLAVAAGDSRTESEVLNTLGMAQVSLGQVDDGVARLRLAMQIARDNDDPDGVAYAYSNLADMLNLAGRTTDALRVAKEGLAAFPRRLSRSHDWMILTISELSFEIGDWEAARDHLRPPPSQLIGLALMFRLIRGAELALGVGEDDVAGRCLEELEPLVAISSEPQWIGAYGALLAEWQRRRGDLLAARDAVAQALDRIELCTEDVMRIARVSGAGARVEADVAQRARDLKVAADARDAVARARIHAQRLRAAAQSGGPVESAWRAVGAAELSRAHGRSDPLFWLRAADEWDGITRPYNAAVVRWRAAEAFVERGDRIAAADAARSSLATAQRVGSRWLTDEVTRLGERARLELSEMATVAAERGGLSEDDPFGLTPRERQVLALIAEGATNRQIGTSLYMAEKTASVHVSRILQKLGVHSRTQAAAVAHRMRLD